MVLNKPVYVVMQPDTAIPFVYFPRKYLAAKLTLSNPTAQTVAFRVKTNVPANYLVKPHSGYLLPQTSIEINITKQPTDYDSKITIDDKFLVNAIPIDNNIEISTLEDPKSFNAVWDSVPKPKVQGHKLSVELNFDALKASSAQNGQNGLETAKFTVEKAKGDISENSSSDDTESSSPKKAPREPDTPKWNIMTSSIGIIKNMSMGSSEILASPTFRRVTKKDLSPEDLQIQEMKKTLEEKISGLEKRVRELVAENAVINKKNQDIVTKMQVHEKLQEELLKEKESLKQDVSNAKAALVEEEARLATLQAEKSPGEEVVVKNEKMPNHFIEGSYQLIHVIIAVIISLFIGALLRE